MKLLSLNCHGLPFTNHRARFGKIAAAIARSGAEVVFLQEVIFLSDLKYFKDLGYKLLYEKKWKLIKGGLVVMAKNEVALGRFHKFKTQGRWLSKQLADRVLGKGVWEIELDGRGLTLINAHLVRVYKEKGKVDRYQEQQLQDLMKLIKSKEKVIVAGDLNINEGSVLYEKLSAIVTDLTKGMGVSFLKKPEKVDYVLASEEVEIKERCFLDEMLDGEWGLSDHRGIFLELAEAKE